MIDAKLVGCIFFRARRHIIRIPDFIELFFDLFGEVIFILATWCGVIKLFLFLNRSSIFLLICHFFCELSFDNGKGKVEQEEGADENDWVEVDEDPGAH